MRLIFLLAAAFLSATASADQASTFERLKSLTGEWKKQGDAGGDFHISFETSANGSVLIENWIYKGASHSLTLYHPDGTGLMATHYCPQGNQPRLQLVESSNDNAISFVFQDATNLPSLDDSHQHSLSFEFVDDNTVLRKESYIKSGNETPSTMRLVRR